MRAKLSEPVGSPVAADFSHVITDDWSELQPVSIGINDGMRELRAKFCRSEMAITTHDYPPGEPTVPSYDSLACMLVSIQLSAFSSQPDKKHSRFFLTSDTNQNSQDAHVLVLLKTDG
jgi:hypothetical protein